MSSIEDKLFLVKFKPDDRSHLIVDPDHCKECKGRPCTMFCPAQVYHWDESEQKMLVAYEGCIECGSCRIGCPDLLVEWRYPRGGFGVQYKFG
ncbi:MAG: ferredoxin family protein [Syntrophothermus sp.]